MDDTLLNGSADREWRFGSKDAAVEIVQAGALDRTLPLPIAMSRPR